MQSVVQTALPIDAHVDAIVAHVRTHGSAIIVAPPGSGKTTRIAPALTAIGKTILLQPRRVAARALARRIADERGWKIGDEIGWQIRFERRFSPRTQLLVATEGILSARLQRDPLLSEFRVVVLDEFHERSIHADLALALGKQAAAARDDLAIVVMSATLDAEPLAHFLSAKIFDIQARTFPIEIEYAPNKPLRDLIPASGDALVFLPGVREITRATAELRDLETLPLHGSLDVEAQERAIAPSSRRKIILSTNIAETSLTVEGVNTVIDSGLHKVLRFDPETAIDHLVLERISRDSAEQRAGRAGRTGPGRALRLWDARDRLRPHREPEVMRIDLAGPLLDVIAWGGDPVAFEWFEAPPEDRVRPALELLGLLGAVDGRRLTPLGQTLRRLPLAPRLARVLAEAGASPRAAAACALLSDRRGGMGMPGASPSTDSDVLALVDRLGDAPGPVRQAARELLRVAERLLRDRPVSSDDASLLKALFAGYPDRVARRREPGSPRLVLASGHGAILGRESGVREGELLVALDVVAGRAGPGSEALVRVASRVEREWLRPTAREVVHRFDPDARAVRAVEREWYLKLVLAERPVPARPEDAGPLLAAALRERGLGEAGDALRRRIAFAGLEVDLPARLESAVAGQTRLPELDIEALLTPQERRELGRLAPAALKVPSGRRVPLEYGTDGQVVAAVKLQELFGLAETPRIGPRREPVTLSLLAPNGRPVQTTRDLRGFWD